MIYSITGTKKEIRDKAHREFSLLGEVTQVLHSEQADCLKGHIDALDMFGDPVVVVCNQLSDNASSKEILISLLGEMEKSDNIFIIDEPFADIHLENKLKKVSKSFFDAREEKNKDTHVFALCDSFAVRDKKQAWLDFVAIRDKVEGEAIVGALWWKFQTVWLSVVSGKKTAFTISDCERIGGDLVRSSILAHRGKRDLIVEIEKIILSL